MAFLDSADLCRRVLLRLNRPATDQAFTTSVTSDIVYDFLTEAQDRVVKLLATFAPDAMWLAPLALSTSDSGKTFTFGLDVDSASIFAMGHYRVYATRSDIPDNPLIPGIEFTVEGTVMRIPNNSTRVFADGGTPWAQWVSPSNVVASGTQPTLPKIARMAMISDAARRCTERLDQDSSKHEAQFQSDWIEVLSAIKTQASFKSSSSTGRNRTYTTGDLSWWPGGRPF